MQICDAKVCMTAVSGGSLRTIKVFIILRAENPDALASGMNAASSV